MIIGSSTPYSEVNFFHSQPHRNIKFAYAGYMKIFLKISIVTAVALLFSGRLLCQPYLSQNRAWASPDREFDNGSKLDSILLTPEKIADLRLLCKVWGFLKYYHPYVATGKLDWDYELFRIMPKVLSVKTTDERNEILLTWVEKFGPVKKNRQKKQDPSKIKIYPDIGWISEKQVLGGKLSDDLVKISRAKRTTGNRYVSLTRFVGNPDFSNEKPYSDMTFPDTGFRLLSLFRYWNIIQYFNPNRELMGTNWDSVLQASIPKFVKVSTATEYKLAVLRLVCCIHDTHADLYRDSDIQRYKGLNMAPFRLASIEGKIVVTGNLSIESKIDSTLLVGDIIFKINGIDIDTIIQQRLPLCSGSNLNAQLRKFSADVLRSNDPVMRVEIDRDGRRIDTTLHLQSIGKVQQASYRLDLAHEPFSLVAPDIGYIYPIDIKKESIDSLMNAWRNFKGIILDLRTYPMKPVLYEIGDYLFREPTPFEIASTGSIENPGMFIFDEQPYKNGHHPVKQGYNGKFVVIVNEYTQSHAEFTAMALQPYKKCTVVGNTTAGADGNVSWFMLPGGVETLISGIGIHYPDKAESQRVGILSKIHVEPSVKGIREKKDELLQAAISVINTE
jgi:hypothetical protein